VIDNDVCPGADFDNGDEVSRLVTEARRIGRAFHLRFVAYLPNQRMQTACGLAALEIAQVYITLSQLQKLNAY